jgi:hypothetical protein
VGKTGQVSINDLSYSVGRQFCGREVSVKIDIDGEKGEFVFFLLIEGAEVKRQAIRGFCPEELISDNAPVSRRRSHGQNKKEYNLKDTAFCPELGACPYGG